jgi:hypothetical protein
MTIVEAVTLPLGGATAGYFIKLSLDKILKKDCSDCTLINAVCAEITLLKTGMLMLVQYSDKIPQDKKDDIMKGLVK